jgi:hypothetical protein
MADDFDRDAAGPRDWSQALAALPMETTPADAWSRLSVALDAPAETDAHVRRPSRAAWWAMAAAVAAIAVIPLIKWGGDPILPLSPDTPTAATTAPPVVPMRTRTRPATAGKEATATLPGEATTVPRIATLEPAVADVSRRPPVARRKPQPIASPSAPEDAQPLASASPDEPRATGDRLQPQAPATAARNETEARIEAASDPLQPLYAESTQLEALVALARDDRVASASGAVLTGELGARLGMIDALLAQPGLSSGERASLWRQRVTTLRQLAGVESTERWLAAHGEAFGDALVRVD